MDSFLTTYSTRHIPAQRLKEYIDGITLYRFSMDSPVYLSPEGRFELILQLDSGFYQNCIHENDWQARPALFVGGLHNNSFRIKPEKKESRLISVRFKSHRARFFIPDKLNLFKNQRVELKDLFGQTSIQPLYYVDETNTEEKNIKLIEDFLIRIFQDRKASPVEIAVNQIENQAGFVNINNLARAACLSVAQLRKRFNEEVGMSPKEYSRIIRTRSIIRLLTANPGQKLTDLTYRLGYFDQSHFIRDFRAVMGMSPKEYLKTT
jgi:AraC-like DNA-binding protein